MFHYPITVNLPATKDRPAEPAPYAMTGLEVLRLLRMDDREDPDSALRRLRAKGILRATRIGYGLVYLLPDVIRCLELSREADPR